MFFKIFKKFNKCPWTRIAQALKSFKFWIAHLPAEREIRIRIYYSCISYFEHHCITLIFFSLLTGKCATPIGKI